MTAWLSSFTISLSNSSLMMTEIAIVKSAADKAIFAENEFLWSPYVIGQTIIFLPCDFYLSSFFFFLA